MVITIQFQTEAYEEQLVARFGGTRLFRDMNGRYFLQGGTVEEQSEALEWIAMFLHYAVPEVIVTATEDGEREGGNGEKDGKGGNVRPGGNGGRLEPKRYGRR